MNAVKSLEEAEKSRDELAKLVIEMVMAIRIRRNGEYETRGEWYQDAVTALVKAGKVI